MRGSTKLKPLEALLSSFPVAELTKRKTKMGIRRRVPPIRQIAILALDDQFKKVL